MLSAEEGEEVDIKPDPDRLKDNLEIDPPSNKQELLSFLGLVNTLRAWSPGITCHTFHLRELSKKQVLVNWGQNESDEFQAIKNLFKNMLVPSPFDPYKPCFVYIAASYTSGF